MNPSAYPIAALLLASAAIALPAQTPATPTLRHLVPTPKPAPKPVVPYLNHNLIFLDPAHGGSDTGAHLPNNLLEKDVTLQLANRIRALLTGSNLTVLLAREADAPPPVEPAEGDQPASAPAPTVPTPDQRAGTANHAHPVACILLHATAAGNGVHIVTSSLPPPDTADDAVAHLHATPWASAQADSLAQSFRLANEIGVAIVRANLPVHLSRASVRPIDSLTCPAVAVEIAPLVSGPTLVSDPTYQQRVAQAVATALLFWRAHADPTPVAPSAAITGAQP